MDLQKIPSTRRFIGIDKIHYPTEQSLQKKTHTKLTGTDRSRYTPVQLT